MFWRLKIKRRRVVRRKRRKTNTKDYAARKEEARALVKAKLEELNIPYGFTYNKVFIKNSYSRWGSCSSKANLNFNYRIVNLPVELQDYLIVHELCHLKEFNHAKPFWDLIAQTIPDWQARRDALRKVRF